MDLKIKNRTAVITGGDSGIGLATAKILAQDGANIVLSDMDKDDLAKAEKEVRELMKEGQTVMSIVADITKNDEVLSLVKEVETKFGKIDILAHCAGIRGAAGDFLTLTDEDWQKSIDVDLMGAVRVCRAFLPNMIANKWGRIVLIASENAFQPYIEESPYNACKAGIINLGKCLSKAYSPKGVLINCVSPAFISTPMTDAMMEEIAEERSISEEEAVQEFLKSDRPNIVVKRRGKPEEVASVIAFLCSENASYVTGSNYRVDGGAVDSAFG